MMRYSARVPSELRGFSSDDSRPAKRPRAAGALSASFANTDSDDESTSSSAVSASSLSCPGTPDSEHSDHAATDDDAAGDACTPSAAQPANWDTGLPFPYRVPVSGWFVLRTRKDGVIKFQVHGFGSEAKAKEFDGNATNAETWLASNTRGVVNPWFVNDDTEYRGYRYGQWYKRKRRTTAARTEETAEVAAVSHDHTEDAAPARRRKIRHSPLRSPTSALLTSRCEVGVQTDDAESYTGWATAAASAAFFTSAPTSGASTAPSTTHVHSTATTHIAAMSPHCSDAAFAHHSQPSIYTPHSPTVHYPHVPAATHQQPTHAVPSCAFVGRRTSAGPFTLPATRGPATLPSPLPAMCSVALGDSSAYPLPGPPPHCRSMSQVNVLTVPYVDEARRMAALYRSSSRLADISSGEEEGDSDDISQYLSE